MTVLRLDHIVKAYDERIVLDGVDLTVERGEVVALIGASGSGKSTLLRTINLLDQIDDGQIWLGDMDISDPRVDADAVRARIGAVFQQYNLFPHLSVHRNITLALRHVHGFSRRRADDTATGILERVGLAAWSGYHPDRLSGGQQQRVAIARAIASGPELLLLDEITAALDPELVGEVLEIVRSLADSGSTILMATHEMSFARDVADRVIFLDQGAIAEQGPAKSVIESPSSDRLTSFLSRFRS